MKKLFSIFVLSVVVLTFFSSCVYEKNVIDLDKIDKENYTSFIVKDFPNSSKDSDFETSFVYSEKADTFETTSESISNDVDCTSSNDKSDNSSTQRDEIHSNIPENQLSTNNDDKDTTYVYITESGEKYHHFGCQYLSKSSYQISLSQAINQGYEPCSKCFNKGE